MLFVNGSICSGNTSDLKVPVDISYKKTAPFVPIQILSFESAFKVNIEFMARDEFLLL